MFHPSQLKNDKKYLTYPLLQKLKIPTAYTLLPITQSLQTTNFNSPLSHTQPKLTRAYLHPTLQKKPRDPRQMIRPRPILIPASGQRDFAGIRPGHPPGTMTNFPRAIARKAAPAISPPSIWLASIVQPTLGLGQSPRVRFVNHIPCVTPATRAKGAKLVT